MTADAQEDEPTPTVQDAASEIIIDSAGICPEYPGGLAVPPQAGEVNEEDIETALSFGGGGKITMYPETIRQIYGLHVYGVDAETPLTVNYNITFFGYVDETIEEGLPTHYFALLDEQFLLLGEEGTLYRDLTLPLSENLTLPIQLPALTPGLHDLVVVGIARPDMAPQNEEGPASAHEGDIQLLSTRITLIAGDPSQISPEDPRLYIRLTEGLPDLQRPANSFYPQLVFALSERSAPWTHPEGTPTLRLPPNADLTYAIHLAYAGYATKYEPEYEGEPFAFANPDSVRFALVVFDGVRPVPIVGDELVFYGEVPRDIYFGRLEMQTTAPSEGIKNLVAVRIDNPGQSLCKYIDLFAFGIHARKVTIEVEAGE